MSTATREASTLLNMHMTVIKQHWTTMDGRQSVTALTKVIPHPAVDE